MSKRRRKQLSILVIPDDGSRTLEFKLSYWVLRIFGGILALLLAAVLSSGVFFWQARTWEQVAQNFKLENIHLKSQVERVDELGQMVSQLKQTNQQLQAMLSEGKPSSAVNYDADLSTRTVLETGGTSMPQVTTVQGREAPAVQGPLDPRWIPSIWPVSKSIGWVTAEFEDHPGVLKNRHLGTDIAAPEGTPVYATADGTVIFAGVHGILGQMVAIDHHGVFMTRYGHNSALLVKVGEEVRKGQPIALVGNSGSSSGPHLHYEVWQDGHPQNPRKFLP